MNRAEAVQLLRQHRQVRLYWMAVLSRVYEGLAPIPGPVLERAYPVEQALGQLTADQRRLLGYLYLDKRLYSPPILCRQLSVSHSTLYRLREQALDAFIKAYAP